jgi:DNA repair protein SbcC/Rad50
MEKLLIAGEFYAQKKTIEALIMDQNNTDFAKSEMIAKIKSNEEKTKAALSEIEDGELKLAGESYHRFKHLKQEVKAKRLEISTLESEVRNLEKTMKDSQKERETIETVISDLNQHMQRFEYKMELLEKSIERVNLLHEEKKEAYEKNQNQLESFLRGDKSLEDEVNSRLTQAEISLANLSSLITKTELNRKHLYDEAEKLRTSMETKEAIALTEQEIKDLNSEVEKLRIEIDSKSLWGNNFSREGV